MITRLILPLLPPSVNVLYKRTKTGRIYLNPDVIEFKAKVKEFIELEQIQKHKGKVFIDISFCGCRKNSDIDNMLKVLLDSMNDLVYIDDKYIYRLVVTKSEGNKKETSVIISDSETEGLSTHSNSD